MARRRRGRMSHRRRPKSPLSHQYRRRHRRRRARPRRPNPSEPRRTDVTVVMNGDLLWHNVVARRRMPAGVAAGAMTSRRCWPGSGRWSQGRPGDLSWRSPSAGAIGPIAASAVRGTPAGRQRDQGDRVRRVHHGVEPQPRPWFAGLKRTLREFDRAGIELRRYGADPPGGRTTDGRDHEPGRQDRSDLGHVQPERNSEASRQAWVVNGLDQDRLRRQARQARKAEPRRSCSSPPMPAPSSPPARATAAPAGPNADRQRRRRPRLHAPTPTSCSHGPRSTVAGWSTAWATLWASSRRTDPDVQGCHRALHVHPE